MFFLSFFWHRNLTEYRSPCLSEHKYPYDWRSKEPTIFRATEQWFASVDGFRNAAMDAIRQVTWVPSQVKKKVGSLCLIKILCFPWFILFHKLLNLYSYTYLIGTMLGRILVVRSFLHVNFVHISCLYW